MTTCRFVIAVAGRSPSTESSDHTLTQPKSRSFAQKFVLATNTPLEALWKKSTKRPTADTESMTLLILSSTERAQTKSSVLLPSGVRGSVPAQNSNLLNVDKSTNSI